MKAFVEFYRESTGYVAGSIPPRFDGPKRLIPACGSDSVMILDGRWGSERCHYEARRVAIERGFPAYQICRGTFANSRPVGFLRVVKQGVTLA